MSPEPFVIPVDASLEQQPAWVIIARAAATTTLINEAVSLAQLQGKESPRTPGDYLSLLLAYRDTDGFPNAFSEQERQSLDDLISQLEGLGIQPEIHW